MARSPAGDPTSRMLLSALLVRGKGTIVQYDDRRYRRGSVCMWAKRACAATVYPLLYVRVMTRALSCTMVSRRVCYDRQSVISASEVSTCHHLRLISA